MRRPNRGLLPHWTNKVTGSPTGEGKWSRTLQPRARSIGKDSPPYLRDGRLPTLHDAVAFFNLVLELRLTASENEDLVPCLLVASRIGSRGPGHRWMTASWLALRCSALRVEEARPL